MVGAAVDDDLAPCLADDRRDDAERRPDPLEHRALLDVQLDIGFRQHRPLDERAASAVGTLLVAEGDDRKRRLGPRCGLECGDDSQHAVEPTAVRHRIEV